MTYHTILRILVHDVSISDVQTLLKTQEGQGFLHIVTANPEMLLAAERNPRLAEVIRNAGLVTADGFGILWVARWMYRAPFTNGRLTGSGDLIPLLLAYANEHQLTIGLLGGDPKEAEASRSVFQSKAPNARFCLLSCGSVEQLQNGWSGDEALLKSIETERPDILLVALGHEKQELWIADRVPHCPSVKIAIGIGGSFAFYSGRLARAPRLLQQLGLEWMWRLSQEPRRIGRIFRAVIVFPIRCILDILHTSRTHYI